MFYKEIKGDGTYISEKTVSLIVIISCAPIFLFTEESLSFNSMDTFSNF